MSAIYNTASLGAKEFGERVHLFDSEQLSLGSGFQVLAAAEVALQGIAVEIDHRAFGQPTLARQGVCHAGYIGVRPAQWSCFLGAYPAGESPADQTFH